MIDVDANGSDIERTTSFDHGTEVPLRLVPSPVKGFLWRGEEKDSQAVLFSSPTYPGMWHSHSFDRRPSKLGRRCSALLHVSWRGLDFGWIHVVAHEGRS